MSSSTANSSERYVTRRIMDKDGNIVVKRYKKRTSSPIKIPWRRVPSAFLGSIFGIYAYIINLYRNGVLRDSIFGEDLGYYLEFNLDTIEGVGSLLFAGAFTVAVATFLGYALVTRGFNIKKWFAAGRQLLAIIAISLLITAVFSSFINEVGIERHQDDQVDVNDTFDVSALSAPFYSELLNGLLDLIGNIPNPEQLVATITPHPDDPATTFDANDDTYLWRWLVAETYTEEFDFEKALEVYQANLANANPDNFPDGADSRKFRISEQYLTLGSSYSGETINPWHSLIDAQVDFSNADIDLNGSEGELLSIKSKTNINNQPIVEASFSKPRTSGYLEFDTYWVEENKTAIAENSILYPDYTTSVKNGFTRGGQQSKAGTVESIWGAESLGGDAYLVPITGANDLNNNTDFLTKYDQYLELGENGTSVYNMLLQISNEIQNAILNLFNDPTAQATLQASGDAATANEAPAGVDRASFFWRQLRNGDLFGIKDAIAGFVNLLRALDIPARPILGFSVGDVEPDKIELRFEHIHVWIEALIPWIDGQGNTQYSWGIFNPIPNYNYLLQGDFVYGKNALGGTPDIEMITTSGDINDIPDSDVGGATSYTLAQQGESLDIATRVLYEDKPTAGQRVDLKILTESEIEQVVNGGIDPTAGLTVGTELGSVTTSATAEAYADFSITAFDNGTTIFGYQGIQTVIPIALEPVNILGTDGNRNVYAVVGTFGLSYAFVLIGFTFEGIIELNVVDAEIVTGIPDLDTIFDGANFDAFYSLVGEDLTYQMHLEDTDGDPVANKEVDLLFLTPDDLSSIEDELFTPADYSIVDPLDKPLLTDTNGDVSYVYAIQASDLIPGTEYYSFVAIVPTSPDVYTSLNVHITNDTLFSYNITDIITIDDRIIEIGEVVTWDVEINDTLTDTELIDRGATVTNRPIPSNFVFNYYIVNRTAYDNINDLRTVFGGCTSDLTVVNPTCYELTEAGFASDTFGIEYRRNSTGFARITMTGGVVSLNSYYLVIYLQDTDANVDTYYVNSAQRFLFSPDVFTGANDGELLIHFGFNSQNEEIVQDVENDGSTIFWFIPALVGLVYLIRRIKE